MIDGNRPHILLKWTMNLLSDGFGLRRETFPFNSRMPSVDGGWFSLDDVIQATRVDETN